ncbi:hypothetical protein ABPG75_005856 [Micractinium tetrahymenae]
MARLDRKGGVSRSAASGSQLKMALLGLVVLAAVLGMLNMAPASLHHELHSSHSRKELRQQTEGAVAAHERRTRLQEEAELEAADGLSATGDASLHADADPARTQTFKVQFDSADGTDADTSLDKAAAERAEQERAVKQQQEEAGKLADEVNTTPGEKYHVICSLGAGIYTQWQSRLAYYWYKKAKEECDRELGDKCQMGGYTRLLHSGGMDLWGDEIPTVVVSPLPAEYQQIAAGYVVLDRPYAFKQWVEKYIDTIPENYIWMGEPDHVFLHAPPLWATPDRPAAFPFFYIEPVKMKHIIDRFNPKQVPIDQFEKIGNSPVQIHKRQFAAIVDSWFKLSIAIKNDTEADREFGWVQEMYAYSIASATTLDKPIRYVLHVEMQLQPPWDKTLISENGRPAYMIHFTYGNDFNEKGEFTPGKVGFWHWDKRDWTSKYIPRNFPLPPEGCNNLAAIELVKRVNEAANHLENWDEYAGQLQTPAAPGDTPKEPQEQRRALAAAPAPLLHGARPEPRARR